jgi:ribonuclease HII
VVDNFVIDSINIRQANKEAMRRSLLEILRKVEEKDIESVVIDGKDNYVFEELSKKPIYII